MSGHYRLSVQTTDPMLTFSLPENMFEDLENRAKDFGRSIETEVMIRLRRTLENDAAMVASDKLLERIFFVNDERDF